MRLLMSAVLCLVATGGVFAQPPVAIPDPPPVTPDPPPAVKACPCPAGPCDCGAACACPACEVDPLWFACRVTVDHGGGAGGAGSGTPVFSEAGRSLVMTNAHVVPRADATKPIRVHVGGRSYPARYVEGSEVRVTGPDTIAVDGPDLCVLEVAADLGAVPVAAGVRPGEPVWQWGYGGTQPGAKPVTRYGTVAPSENYVVPTLLTTIRSVSGDSGAGVFNTKGELVGVTWGGDGATHRAVPLTTVRAFVGRPVLARLFPRLGARFAGVVAAPVATAALTVPAAMPSGLPPAIVDANGCTWTPARGADGAVYWTRTSCPLRR